MRFLVLAAAFLLALAGCHRTDPPSTAPTGVTATAGDGLVLLSWDTLPDLTYWIFFQPGSSVAAAATGSTAIRRAVPPRAIPFLLNGTQYAFVMNATHDGSSAGPSSPVVLATPRLAGDDWRAGTAISPNNLRAVVFTSSRFVAVGDAATIFAGDYNYASTAPPGVTAWVPATSLPAGFASNLSSIVFNGIFVALGTNGSVVSSVDGLTWAAGGTIPPNTGMNGIAFAQVFGVTPTYVAVGNGGSIFTSPDFTNWTPRVSNTLSDLTSVTLLNSLFIVTGAGGTLLTSPDGINWTTAFSGGNTLRSVTFRSASPLGTRYVAVGDTGTIVTSVDGVTWSPITPSPLAQDLRSVTVGGASGSRFLAVGQAGTVAYSDDGLAWTIPPAVPLNPNLAAVTVAPSLYLAVGDGGANAVSK